MCNTKPTIINGNIRNIDKSNLSYVEPHRIIIKGITFLAFNYSKTLYVGNLSNKLELKDLESNLLEHISEFLLELGRGFSFVSRQRRIDVDGDNFYTDLVFYNYVLKCFVLIDLKLDKLAHQDIGQMDFYVRYFDNEIKDEQDNPTIGIILCYDKKDTIVKYSVLNDNKNLFASKY